MSIISFSKPLPEAMAAKADEAARMLRSLANPHRLQVLCLLVQGEMSVGAVQQQVALSQSALSQHLARLREEGLVETRREGTSIFYRIADPAVLQIMQVLAAIYCPPES
ncbi:metalloregulator ArsR/SmtB family transcription factor [Blastomonas sp. UPD001]|uniref:ArsR/SmtB family transcription factor n=1 Tax=Blastomonas sp. UPD001 TaxID=2217673 RepID=UPI001E2B2AC7|nr:metalloregulator ArsR/SmtB family transcription factor [Blastomonas sp. UPD001]